MPAVLGLVVQLVLSRHKRRQTTEEAIEQRRRPRDRVAMLKRVRHHWIQSVLEESLDSQTRIALRLLRCPEAVRRSRTELRRTGREPEALPAGTTATEVFD